MPTPLALLPASVRNALAVILCAAALWLVIAFQLFVNVDPLVVGPTDAVVVLGGAASERLPVARRVQENLGIPVLVISHTDTPGNALADEECNTRAFPSASVVCFTPDDYDTRGEARDIAKLVEVNGWKSVTVVTSSYHATRAGRLMEQCTTAKVQLVASHPDLDLGQWLRRFVIETGGLVDVSFRPEC